MLRPIYSPNDLPEKTENGIPPRPRVHRKVEKRRKQGDELPKSIGKMGMNLYRGVLLAGYGIFPNCYAMLYQHHAKPEKPAEAFGFGSNLEYQLHTHLKIWFYVTGIVMIFMLIFAV
jgi:hypothetical protein